MHPCSQAAVFEAASGTSPINAGQGDEVHVC